MELNVNCKVKVKLTAEGRIYLAQRHQQIFKDLENKPEFKLPKTDKKGYTEWHLWDLIGTFGDCCKVPTMAPPFKPTIIINLID